MAHSSRMFAVAAVALLVAGCGDSDERRTDSSATPATHQVARAPRGPVPGDVIALAGKYHFAPTLLPPAQATTPIDKTGKNQGVDKTKDPHLTFARAETVSGTSYPTDQEVLLLVDAKSAYPGLDIAQGNNYIWRDRSDPDKTKWTVWLVSEHPARAVELKRFPHPYSVIDPMLPHLVVEKFQVKRADSTGAAFLTDMIAYGACIDDPACLPSGHCGYSQ
jgi:hypothetical protein